MRYVWKRFLFILACAGCAWGLHPAAAADLLAKPGAPGGDTRELIVLLAPGAKAPSPESLVDNVKRGFSLPGALGLSSPKGARLAITERLQGAARDWMLAHPDSSAARLERYVVLSYPAVVDLEAVKRVLAADPAVQYVEENVRIPLSAVPNDPLFQVQGSPTAYQWGSYTLNLPAAWDRIAGHAYVGLTDTGLEVNHPDLRAFHQVGSTWVFDGGNFRRQLSCEFVNGTSCDDPSNSVDEHSPVQGRTPVNFGHGTHTSGILAATPNNSIGVAGACQHCSLMMAKVSTVDPFTFLNASPDTVALGKGTKWLTDHGAQVISASLGGPSASDCPVVNSCDDPTQPCPFMSFYCQNIAYMDSHDVTMFAASGNYYRDIDFPAKDPRIIAVGGIMSDGSFWKEPNCSSGDNLCGSNYTMTPGSAMQALVAPSKDVMSTFYEGYTYFPPLCGNTSGYGLCTGTSMASPYAAGIGGLVRSANPLLNKAAVRTILTSTASRSAAGLGWDSKLGYGYPNAASAVDAALGKAAGVTLKNRLTPLFSFYSSLATDSLYTTVPQMAAGAILGASGYAPSSSDPMVPGYAGFPGVPNCQVSPCANGPRAAVYVFTSDKAPYTGSLPLVPLYRMTYKPASASDPHRDTTYTTDSTGLVSFKGVGYELDGIEGYIYQRCTPEPSCIPAGAVRLYRLYNASRDDYAIFPESQLAAMQAAGYVSSPGLNDWIGYVYPNVDSDGDQLINGFETLIGTNPNAADSDCDGSSDGAEVLNYPYSDPLGSPGCSAPPVASFSFTCSLLACSFNSAGTTGTGTLSYAWTFGDAGTGSGATTSHTYGAVGTYTVTLTVTDPLSRQSSQSRKVQVANDPVAPAENYFAVAPCRVLDTRNTTILTNNVPRVVAIAGSCGIPSTAKAVSFNVTAVSPTGSGKIALYPGNLASTWSGAKSSVNFDPATSPRANSAVIQLATDGTGTVGINTAVTGSPGQVHAVLDVQGYFSTDTTPAAGATGPLGFQTVPACRLADTGASPLVAGTARTFTAQGVCGVPAGAAVASMRVGVTSPAYAGFIVAYPSNLATPGVSTLNFKSGISALRNGARVNLAPSTPDFAAVFSGAAGASVSAHFDVDGYFKSDAPLKYHPIAPCRPFDTGDPQMGGPVLVTDTPRTLQIQGNCGVPVGAKAVALRLVISSPTAAGNLSVYPSNLSLPAISTMKFDAGEPGLSLGAIVPLSTLANDLTVTAGQMPAGGTVGLTIDVFGYFQ